MPGLIHRAQRKPRQKSVDLQIAVNPEYILQVIVLKFSQDESLRFQPRRIFLF